MNRDAASVLMVGRHFWPHGSHDSAMHLTELAQGLSRGDVDVQVLTPRHAADWVPRITLGSVPVHRPVTVPRNDWTIGRYVRSLTTWIRDHGRSLDALFADSMREEAVAVVEAGRILGLPSVVRDFGFGPDGDLGWCQQTRSNQRYWKMAASADVVLCSTAPKHRQLLSLGVSPDRVRRIAGGIAATATPTADARRASRAALAAVNLDLQTDSDTVVIVCPGRMTSSSGMSLMVDNAYWMLSRYVNARLWLIGDGPARDLYFQSLKFDGLRQSIAMPGSFASMADVLAAADLVVLPDDQGLESMLPAVLAAQVPLVLCDGEGRSAIAALSGDALAADESLGTTWFRPGDGKSLRDAIRTVLDDLPASREQATLSHKRLIRHRSAGDCIAQYATLFNDLKAAAN